MMMKTDEIERIFIGKKVYHVANDNEIIKKENCDNQTVAVMYIENNVLNVVTKDAQYLYKFFNEKNIESWGKENERTIIWGNGEV